MKKALRRIFPFLIALLLTVSVCAETRPVLEEYYANFNYPNVWLTERAEIKDSAYTFAFVGDTQMVTYFDEDNLCKIYDWIVEIAEKENLKHVFGLGDITQMNVASEWKLAVSQIQKLDGVVPYTLVRGNHDGGSEFRKYCGYDSYKSQLDGMFNNTILNSYKLFSVGTIDYLFLNLDYGPSDKVLEWACGVVEQYPERNVIITTHAYLAQNGEPIDENNTAESIVPTNDGGFNNGIDIWEKLVKKYSNIVMVVSGHVGNQPQLMLTELTGDNGNVVKQLLIDPQRLDLQALGKPDTLDVESGSVGLVALFHFSADGKSVQVENYSTIQKRYYGPGLEFELNCLGGNALETPTAEDAPPATEDAPPAAEEETPNEAEVPVSEEAESAAPVFVVVALAAALAVVVCVVFLLRKRRGAQG